MKISVTIIPTDLVINSPLSSFYPFLQTQTQVGGLITRNISFLFVASCTLLQTHAEFNRLL